MKVLIRYFKKEEAKLIPVPIAIGKCKYINDLTKPELKEIIQEYIFSFKIP